MADLVALSTLRTWASTMRRLLKWLSAIAALMACSASFAQQSSSLASHCKQGEFAFLNASMQEVHYPRYKTEDEKRTKPLWILQKTDKVLSICADRPAEPFNLIAYRFGKIGNIELERIATQSSPFHIFERTTSPHTGEAILFFSAGPYTYCVSEATAQGSGISLSVLKSGREVASFFSGNDRGTDYEAGLFELNQQGSPGLRKFRPKNDFQTPCDAKHLIRP